MIIELHNENLKVQIESKGAELKSIRSSDIEYLWQGDAKSWKRSAPILFPIVGAINNDRYVYNNKSYKMTQHGFARDMEFQILKQNTNSVIFSLESSDETRKMFPFDFELILGYEISKNLLKISYEVINKTDGSILFSIGAHPGFNCPLDNKLEFSDYKLVLDQDENSDRRLKNDKVMNGKTSKYFNGNREIALEHNLFKDGALIFDDLKSTSITLESDKDTKKVVMEFDGFPYFGIWSWPPEPANYICLEPWYGIDSTIGDTPDWEKKEGLINLDSDGVFKGYYTIKII